MNRKEKSQITRNKIVNAAKELIKEKMIKDISVEDITIKAEVSKGSFYTYFDKKEDVIALFMYENWEQLRHELLNIENKEETFKYYVDKFASFIEQKGKETCRSWISSNIDNDYKLLFDENTLKMFINDEIIVRTINAYLYGLMLSWVMSSDDRDFINMSRDALPSLISLMKEDK